MEKFVEKEIEKRRAGGNMTTSYSPPQSPARKLHSSYESRLQSPGSAKGSAKENRQHLKRHSFGSPARDKVVYCDRAIPSRSGSHLDLNFTAKAMSPPAASNNSNSEHLWNGIIRSEVLGVEPSSPNTARADDRAPNNQSSSSSPQQMFQYRLERPTRQDEIRRSLSTAGSGAQSTLSSPRKATRKIPKAPFKVLDAPNLQDDFYLNLVDWSSSNVLSVGLGPNVYLWSACTSKVTQLCHLEEREDSITSVSWAQMENHLAVGTNNGEVQIWDATKCKEIRKMRGHNGRVGTMAWNSNRILASGSRDRTIYQRDVRVPRDHVGKLSGHKQEVCGLRWSFDDQQLASGGNDNKLFVWNSHSTTPVSKFNDHTAAVKAIAWSPHQHGLLASGGGTADRCIRFWNTLSSSPLSCVDTGSQVCNLMWSKNINEVVSTHGYSLNQIILWRYPSMTKVATLTGHTYRVLYLAMSPDGQTIVTGAGDETLRFWNTFPGPKNKDGSRLGTGLLFPAGADIR